MKKMHQDKIKAHKIAYITDQLNLSAEEAQKFWPIYNDYNEKIENFKKDGRRDILSEIKLEGGIDKISETKAFVIIEKDMVMKKALLVFEKEFTKKLQKFLPNTKILKLQAAEKDFKRKLFNEFIKRRKKN